MSTVAAIRKLLASGFTIEQALTAAEAFESGPKETARQARNRRYYETHPRGQASEKRLNRLNSDASENRLKPSETVLIKTPLARVEDKPLTLDLERFSLSEDKSSSREARAKPSRRMPADWLPSHADMATIEAMGFSSGEIERELAMIRDFEFKTPRSDWGATVRNWFRREEKNRPANGTSPPSAKFLARQANLERSFAGAQRAALRRT